MEKLALKRHFRGELGSHPKTDQREVVTRNQYLSQRSQDSLERQKHNKLILTLASNPSRKTSLTKRRTKLPTWGRLPTNHLPKNEPPQRNSHTTGLKWRGSWESGIVEIPGMLLTDHRARWVFCADREPGHLALLSQHNPKSQHSTGLRTMRPIAPSMFLKVIRLETNHQAQRQKTSSRERIHTWGLRMPHLKRKSSSLILWPSKISNCLIEGLVCHKATTQSKRSHSSTTPQ